MRSGDEVLRSIRSQISAVENQVEGVKRKKHDTMRSIDRLEVEKDGQYVELASIYLPQMEDTAVEQIGQMLPQLRDRINGILKQKEKREQVLEDLMQQQTEQRRVYGSKLAEVEAELREKVIEVERIQGEIHAALGENEQYGVLKIKADQAQTSVQQNQSRAEAFEENARSKLKAYESNSLFMYLVKRDGKDVGRIMKTLDSWIASVVHFRENEKNYNFLKAMPELINKEVESQQAELNKLKERLERIEDETEERYGLPALQDEKDLIEGTRGDVLTAIDKTNELLETYNGEFSQLQDTRGTYYEEARKQVVGLLKGEGIQKLIDRSRKTPDERDDCIIDKIQALMNRADELSGKLPDFEAEEKQIEEKLQGLREIEHSFLRNNYNSNRSQFNSSFNVGDFLAGYLAGRFSASEVTSSIGNSHSLKPVQTYTSHSYSSSSSSRRSSYGGGGGISRSSFGGGGRSSGGGFGGGGRRSGGRF